MFNGLKRDGVSSRLGNPFLWAFRIPFVLGCVYLLVTFVVSPTWTATRGANSSQFSMQGYGFVLDGLTGAPLRGARVSIGRASFEALTGGQYEVNGLSSGIQRAVVTHSGYVPSSITFTVFEFGEGGLSVHIPPAYLVPKQPFTPIAPGGGSIHHGGYEVSFPAGGFSASLVGFQDHPGTPAPPDEMPTMGRPKPPREPVLPPTRPRLIERPFPLAVFNAEFPDGEPAAIRAPLAISSELVGAQLPLLRFNTMTALWDRAGELAVAQQLPGVAEGSISQPGLYMVVTIARLDRQSVGASGESREMTVPLKDNGFMFTLPVSYEVEGANPPGMKTAAFWFYGWRERDDNPTGVVVNVPPSGFTKALSHCPPEQLQACVMAEGVFRDLEITVDGCGSTVSYRDCVCCPRGTQPQANITIGKASDEYNISIGLSPDEITKVKGELKTKADKRKEDIKIQGAGCK